MQQVGKFVRKASVRDLQRDRYDRSQAQADIVVENMTADGVPVLVDFGVTHSLLLSYVRAAAQRGELDAEGASKRAHAANIYANKKNKRYNKTIKEKELDLNYQSFIVDTYCVATMYLRTFAYSRGGKKQTPGRTNRLRLST